MFRFCLANSEAKHNAAGPEPKIKISSISILSNKPFSFNFLQLVLVGLFLLFLLFVHGVLIASAFGLGKRVPVTQFRLQKRAGMGLRAIKFRIKDDVLVCLKVLGEGEELLFVTGKGVIVRTNADKISQQSRAATGVKLQKLDEGDHLSEVVLVPREQTEEIDQIVSGEEN